MKYEEYTAEIETADAQESHERGVIVLVTGHLTGNDNVRKKFSQTFFLAPQDKGYFVLNDVFRFLEEKEVTAQARSVPINGNPRDVQAPVEPGTIFLFPNTYIALHYFRLEYNIRLLLVRTCYCY